MKERCSAESKSLWPKVQAAGLSLLTAAGLIGGAFFLSQPKSADDISSRAHLSSVGIYPSAEVDANLVKSIIDIESSYPGNDLKGSGQQLSAHLKLSAQVFEAYSGESLSARRLVESVRYLPDREFKSLFGSRAAAAIYPVDGLIYLNTESDSYQPANYWELHEKMAFHALSIARRNYTHEGFHLAGLDNPRIIAPNHPLNLFLQKNWSAYFSYPSRIEEFAGFVFKGINIQTNEKGGSNTLEEIYAYQKNNLLDKKLNGRELESLEPFYQEPAMQGIAVGNHRLRYLFDKKPELLKVYQKFHQESDPYGFAEYLTAQNNLKFQTNQARGEYISELLMSIPSLNSRSESFFQRYLTSLGLR